MTQLFMHPSIILALCVAFGAAGIALAAGWLTRSGAAAAAITGFLVYWLGGGIAAVPLIAFFVSSSLLTVVGRHRSATKQRISGQSTGRTGVQVCANGGAAVVLVVAHKVFGYHITLDMNRMVQIMFLAAISTVTADTWATEIGSRWGGYARQLSTWRKVAAGTSGAISMVGTAAAAAGALFIPFCAYRLWDMTNAELVAAAWAGLLGCLFDSILGAGLQAQFRNPNTNEISDSAVTNGQRNTLIRGLRWIDNNVVNFIAAIAGALFCWVLLHYGLRRVM